MFIISTFVWKINRYPNYKEEELEEKEEELEEKRIKYYDLVECFEEIDTF